MVVPAIIALAVIQGVSEIQKGRAAKEQAAFARQQAEVQGAFAIQQAEAQQAIAERNAQLAERQAEAETQAALAEAKKQAREGKRFLARQRAAFAVSGVAIGRGTPLAVVVETAAELKAEELTILREGIISAAQRRGEADIFRLRGDIFKLRGQVGAETARLTGLAATAKGKAASRAATLAATGSILTGIGQVGVAKSKGFTFFGPKP